MSSSPCRLQIAATDLPSCHLPTKKIKSSFLCAYMGKGEEVNFADYFLSSHFIIIKIPINTLRGRSISSQAGPSVLPLDRPPFHSSVCPYFYPFVRPSVRPFTHPTVRPSFHPSVLRIPPSVRPSMYPSLPALIVASYRPSVRPSFHPSVVASVGFDAINSRRRLSRI